MQLDNRSGVEEYVCEEDVRWCWLMLFFFFSSRRRHTRCSRDWSSDVCSSDLEALVGGMVVGAAREIVREAEHVGDFFREVVGVFVAVAVAEIFHKASGGIAHIDRKSVV